jgi:hypothetical protein
MVCGLRLLVAKILGQELRLLAAKILMHGVCLLAAKLLRREHTRTLERIVMMVFLSMGIMAKVRVMH